MIKIKINAGFTLLELMMVLVVLGILLSIAIPNMWEYMNRQELLSDAQLLVQDLREIQNLAITNSSTYQIHLNTTKKYYYLKYYDTMTPAIRKVSLHNSIKTISVTSNVPKQGEYYIISYNYAGTPIACSITMVSSEGKQVKITIEVVTGRVKLYEL